MASIKFLHSQLSTPPRGNGVALLVVNNGMICL